MKRIRALAAALCGSLMLSGCSQFFMRPSVTLNA